MKIMPKKEAWITKEKKRESKAEDKGIVDFIRILTHYFKMNDWIKELKHISHIPNKC